MGMDVYGREPISETGKYFRRNIWGWHPLAEYLQATYPTETAGCKLWHTNDGDGLDAGGAKALADAIHRDNDNGVSEAALVAFAVTNSDRRIPTLDDLDEFAAFLMDSGGFEIH